ncbi:ectonucleotide pyrophosphatase phosphodiesterase [Balamuthia mandrillaris]
MMELDAFRSSSSSSSEEEEEENLSQHLQHKRTKQQQQKHHDQEEASFTDLEVDDFDDGNSPRSSSPLAREPLYFNSDRGCFSAWRHMTNPQRTCVLISLSVFLLTVLVIAVAGWRVATRDSDDDGPSTPSSNATTVILISLDGFRAEYLRRAEATSPTLHTLMKGGVYADGLIPCFPTKTFPNHYSIVTGLYPESHGIVANRFFDPSLNATFSLGDADSMTNGRWWGGEPIWITAEMQNVVAATMFWPGSEVEIKEKRPSYYKAYDAYFPFSQRIEQVLEWLSLSEQQRPSLVTLYLERVDWMGHEHGPDSDEVAAAILEVDGYIGDLLDGLRELGLEETTDIIVVSDHGMTSVSNDRVIDISSAIAANGGNTKVVDSTPIMGLFPASPQTTEALLDVLVGVHPNITIFRKEEMPEELHYSSNDRIPPLVGIADLGWSIRTPKNKDEIFTGGTHGYLNTHEDMFGIFVARGPHFQSGGLRVDAFENIHLYNMLAEILNLEPAPNNGTLSQVSQLLRQSHR